MKLRIDRVGLWVVGLTLGALAVAIPVWASIPPANQSENARGEVVFGISRTPWLGDLGDSLGAVVAREVDSEKEADFPTLTVPGDQYELLASKPPDWDKTERGPEINPDG
jgi:hypothetical protein